MYKYIYEYMYVYIWEYANPCKLKFAWWIFSLGFKFVYVQKVEKYFCRKKWIVVIHVAEKVQKALLHSRRFTVEGFTAQQKALLRSRRLYCTAEGFTALQKALLHIKKFYSTTESFTAQQKSQSCGRTREKFLLRQK